MHNWSDEELDRLSRDAAERYTAPPAEGGWEALSRRLDEEMPVKDRKRRAFFWLFFAGLLLGGTIYYSGTHKGPPSGSAISKTVAANPASQLPSTDMSRAETPHTGTIPDGGAASGPISQNKQVSSNTSLHIGPAKRVVHGPAAGVPQGTGTDRKSKVKQYQGKVPPAEAGNGDEPPVPARSAEESSEQSPVASGQKPVVSGQEPVASGQSPVASGQKPVASEQKAVAAESKTDNRKPITDNRRPGRWEFSLSMAPDLSAVEFYPLAKAGIMGGGTVGFHISERWTVSTGLFYTVKHYDSPGEAYHLPGYWANNPWIKMNQVNAVCNMWDIPLNVRYDFFVNKGMRLFASTGLSSYLMRKEDLHYYYTYRNNPYDKSYVYKNKSDYWFSVANISAGVERNIGKGFSLQAEPFAKFSLADVGTGKIRLNSYGLFVGLKYRPFKVVRPHH